MSTEDLEQGTDAWRQARAGCVTASRIADVMRKPRRGQKESTTRKAYLAQIAVERLTGKANADEFETWDMKRGTQLEPFARAEYELKNGGDIQTVGFIEHPKIPHAGCSPDILVGVEGLAQIKCPRTHIHLDYLMAGIVPVDYRPQMLFELAVTGRKWNDFVSYCQEMPDHLQLFVARLEANQAEIEEIEAEVLRFNQEVEEIIARLPKHAGESVLSRQLQASL